MGVERNYVFRRCETIAKALRGCIKDQANILILDKIGLLNLFKEYKKILQQVLRFLCAKGGCISAAEIGS